MTYRFLLRCYIYVNIGTYKAQGLTCKMGGCLRETTDCNKNYLAYGSYCNTTGMWSWIKFLLG